MDPLVGGMGSNISLSRAVGPPSFSTPNLPLSVTLLSLSNIGVSFGATELFKIDPHARRTGSKLAIGGITFEE
jgi:hypothetical protein